MIVAMLSLLAASSASAWEWVTGPPKEVVVPWRLAPNSGIEGEHTITIVLLGGYCAGEPQPRAGKVSVVELPVSAADPRPTAIITAHQFESEPSEVSGEVPPPSGEDPSRPIPVCAGLGWSMTKRIKLKRPAEGMRLLDDSGEPPERRSPPGGLR